MSTGTTYGILVTSLDSKPRPQKQSTGDGPLYVDRIVFGFLSGLSSTCVNSVAGGNIEITLPEAECPIVINPCGVVTSGHTREEVNAAVEALYRQEPDA